MKTFALAAIAAVAAAQELSEIVGDITWESLRAVLAANEDVSSAADVVSAAFQAEFAAQQAELPEVCEGGLVCRGAIFTDARIEIQQYWQLALQDITLQLQNVIVKSENIMSVAYDGAFECEADCPCDYIMTEYIEVLQLQNEIWTEIQILDEEILVLTEQQEGILTECPEYSVLVVTSTTTTTTTDSKLH